MHPRAGALVPDSRAAVTVAAGVAGHRRYAGRRHRTMPAPFRTDLRLTFRHLRTHAGYALAAIVTLALGVGATTAMFSAVYAVLLAPQPIRDADRLVVGWGAGPRDLARPGRAHLPRRRSARRRQPHRRADGRGRRIDVDGRARRPRRAGAPGLCRRLRCVLRDARGPGGARARVATTRRRAGRRQRARAQPPRLGRSLRRRPGDRRSAPSRLDGESADRDRRDAAGLRLPARRRVLDAAGARPRRGVGDLEDRRARQRRRPDVRSAGCATASPWRRPPTTSRRSAGGSTRAGQDRRSAAGSR